VEHEKLMATVSAVGRDEEVTRKYIREQEVEHKRVDRLKLF
jgi:hypothetical protein